MATNFPPKRSGGPEMDGLLERMGGTSSRQRLESCTVCGRPVWVSTLHAHAACLESLGVVGVGYAPPTPVRPPSVVGNVYASINVDSHVAQVSDRAGREAERAAREAVDRLPSCRVCAKPLTVGQRGVHHECDDAPITPTKMEDGNAP